MLFSLAPGQIADLPANYLFWSNGLQLMPLSQAEIDRAVADARAYAGEDRLRRRQAAARDAAEAVLYKAEAADRKSMSREEKKRLDEAEKRLRKALRGRDAGEMEQAAEEMKAVLQR